MKIRIHRKENCDLCTLLTQHVNLIKGFIEIPLEVVRVENQIKAPKLEFWNDKGKKVSELNGVPMISDVEYMSVAIILYILRGIYDTTKEPKVLKHLEAYSKLIEENVKVIKKEDCCNGK